MTAANLHHRAKRPELLAIVGIVGVVAFAGTAVARRFLSRARSTPEVRRTAEAAGTASPLIGYEFRLSGDRFRILESARQTDDGSLRGDYVAPPGAKVPEHVHLGQEESFEVVSGTLGVSVGGRELTLSPGQSAVGPPDVPHKWWNPGDEEVHFLVGLRPALHMETVFETWFGLAQDGKTIGWLPKNPLQLAVLADEVGGWFYYTGVPKPVWKALFAPVALLAFIGRLLGYRARYPEYSGPEAAPVRLFKLSTEIRRPPDEVFAFVADLRNDLYWGQRVVKEVRQISEVLWTSERGSFR
jgi:mannose-6-phosphate isomerase-like protein (cupin superfamily)